FPYTTLFRSLAGSPVTFSGTANDLEDGPLGARLVWTSDRDGTLGTGASITKALSPGPHRITAAVTDTGGLVGTATVGVTVVRIATLEVAPAADAYVDAGSPSGTIGAVRTGQSVEVDITGAVTGDGTYDLALVANSPDEALYRSRETTTPPKLVLTLTGNPPTVAITAPPTGAVFFAGAPVTLAG